MRTGAGPAAGEAQRAVAAAGRRGSPSTVSSPPDELDAVDPAARRDRPGRCDSRGRAHDQPPVRPRAQVGDERPAAPGDAQRRSGRRAQRERQRERSRRQPRGVRRAGPHGRRRARRPRVPPTPIPAAFVTSGTAACAAGPAPSSTIAASAAPVSDGRPRTTTAWQAAPSSAPRSLPPRSSTGRRRMQQPAPHRCIPDPHWRIHEHPQRLRVRTDRPPPATACCAAPSRSTPSPASAAASPTRRERPGRRPARTAAGVPDRRRRVQRRLRLLRLVPGLTPARLRRPPGGSSPSGNLGWAAASVAMVVTGWHDPTTTGTVWIVMQGRARRRLRGRAAARRAADHAVASRP